MKLKLLIRILFFLLRGHVKKRRSKKKEEEGVIKLRETLLKIPELLPVLKYLPKLKKFLI
jgi:hypothetical protein